MPLRKSVSWLNWGAHWETDFFEKCLLSLKNTCFYKFCYVIHFEFPLEFSKAPRYFGKVTFLHLGPGGLLALSPKEFSWFWISQWCINGASSPNSKSAFFLRKITYFVFFRFWPRIVSFHKENRCFVKIISIYDPFSSSRAWLRQSIGSLRFDMSAMCTGFHPAQILRS